MAFQGAELGTSRKNGRTRGSRKTGIPWDIAKLVAEQEPSMALALTLAYRDEHGMPDVDFSTLSVPVNSLDFLCDEVDTIFRGEPLHKHIRHLRLMRQLPVAGRHAHSKPGDDHYSQSIHSLRGTKEDVHVTCCPKGSTRYCANAGRRSDHLQAIHDTELGLARFSQLATGRKSLFPNIKLATSGDAVQCLVVSVSNGTDCHSVLSGYLRTFSHIIGDRYNLALATRRILDGVQLLDYTRDNDSARHLSLALSALTRKPSLALMQPIKMSCCPTPEERLPPHNHSVCDEKYGSLSEDDEGSYVVFLGPLSKKLNIPRSCLSTRQKSFVYLVDQGEGVDSTQLTRQLIQGADAQGSPSSSISISLWKDERICALPACRRLDEEFPAPDASRSREGWYEAWYKEQDRDELSRFQRRCDAAVYGWDAASALRSVKSAIAQRGEGHTMSKHVATRHDARFLAQYFPFWVGRLGVTDMSEAERT